VLLVGIVEPSLLAGKGIAKMLSEAAHKKINFVLAESADCLKTKKELVFQLVVIHIGQLPVDSEWVRKQILVINSFGLPSLVLGTIENRQETTSALALGTRGYVLSNWSAEIIVCAIRIVIEGGEMIPPGAVSPTFKHKFDKRAAEPVHDLKPEGACPSDYVPNLTSRERMVLERLYHGSTNKQIADAIGISPRTAKVHVRNIFKKLKATNRTEACVIAREISEVEALKRTQCV
jgi:DNA-binding NarL/FixJ family response regulator